MITNRDTPPTSDTLHHAPVAARVRTRVCLRVPGPPAFAVARRRAPVENENDTHGARAGNGVRQCAPTGPRSAVGLEKDPVGPVPQPLSPPAPRECDLVVARTALRLGGPPATPAPVGGSVRAPLLRSRHGMSP